jgi:ribosomal protein L35AE/L33A
MPSRENFSTPEYFYSTVLHEIAHSTGHHSMMNREDLGKPFGSPEYAKEELRAEMASAFVFQEIGMPLSEEDMEGHVKDHAAYTQFWLDSLKNDYKEFYKAARDAAKIADYTLAYERAHAKTNTAEAANEPSAIADPVQAAKSAIGRNAIVTSAQAGKTYTGEIVSIEGDYAVQKIASGRGIVHDLHKIADRAELTGLFSLQKDGGKISISYDGERNASVKTQSRDEERESAVTR